MKYAIVLPDGAADEPLAQLGGRTPLEVARIPHMHWIAQHGQLGRVVTVPDGFTPGTDVATLALLGYDPHRYYSGRAPLEAAAKGLRVGPDELVVRCNFVTVADGCMRDFTAGHIRQDEAQALIEVLERSARAGDPALRGCAFHAGVGYRNLLLLGGAADYELVTAPPHDIPNQPVAAHLPRGRGEARLRRIMRRAAELIGPHEVNTARAGAGQAPVTGVWLWGQGRPRTFEPFVERFGVRGAVITAVDIIRGIATLAGLTLIPVAGATGYLDTDYAAKARAASAALSDYDVVIVHVEATDEAAHLGRADEKIKALERVDELVVGPLLAQLRALPEWRILIAPDHVTSTRTTAHHADPPPFCLGGTGIAPGGGRCFTESDAAAGGVLHADAGEVLRALLDRAARAPHQA